MVFNFLAYFSFYALAIAKNPITVERLINSKHLERSQSS